MIDDYLLNFKWCKFKDKFFSRRKEW